MEPEISGQSNPAGRPGLCRISCLALVRRAIWNLAAPWLTSDRGQSCCLGESEPGALLSYHARATRARCAPHCSAAATAAMRQQALNVAGANLGNQKQQSPSAKGEILGSRHPLVIAHKPSHLLAAAESQSQPPNRHKRTVLSMVFGDWCGMRVSGKISSTGGSNSA